MYEFSTLLRRGHLVDWENVGILHVASQPRDYRELGVEAIKKRGIHYARPLTLHCTISSFTLNPLPPLASVRWRGRYQRFTDSACMRI